MTMSTPRSNDGPAVSSHSLLNLSRFTMERDTLHSKPPVPPCLPSPQVRPTPRSTAPSDLPTSLSLPMLAPRAPKRSARGETSASLMDFVNLMSITDVTRSRTSYTPSHKRGSSFVVPPPGEPFCLPPPELKDELSAQEEKKDEREEMEGSTATARRLSFCHGPPPSLPQWALTTPETMKNTISTPLALRNTTNANSNCHKRKSPVVHSTPVDGNRPLMLPSLSTIDNSYSLKCQHHQRSAKKAKSYKTLLNNAPMLPASPDLEDRMMAAPRHPPAPCFSPPLGMSTFVNPNYRIRATPSDAMPPPPPAMPAPPTATAGLLPSLDESERSAPKWLRMKKRTSLLCALRMAASET